MPVTRYYKVKYSHHHSVVKLENGAVDKWGAAVDDAGRFKGSFDVMAGQAWSDHDVERLLVQQGQEITEREYWQFVGQIAEAIDKLAEGA